MSKPGRVLLLSHLPPPYGGLTVHTERLRAMLLRHGWQVEVLSPPGGPIEPGVGFRRIHVLRRQVRFLRKLAFEPVDVVHDHITNYWIGTRSLTILFFHVLTLLAIQLPRRRWILSSGNGLLPRAVAGTGRPLRLLYAALYRRVNLAVAKNEPIFAAFRQLGLGDRSRIVGTFLRPDVGGEAGPFPPELTRWLASHDRVVVSVGFRFEPLYNLDRVVRAVAEARTILGSGKGGPGLLVLGSHAEDPAGKPALDAAIEETAMQPHVLVLRDVDYALDAIARAAVLVRATDVEGDANTVKEAMWVGTPVLATDLPGRPPGIELFPPRGWEQLGRRLAALLASPDPARVASNRAFVKADIARSEAALLRIYEEARR